MDVALHEGCTRSWRLEHRRHSYTGKSSTHLLNMRSQSRLAGTLQRLVIFELQAHESTPPRAQPHKDAPIHTASTSISADAASGGDPHRLWLEHEQLANGVDPFPELEQLLLRATTAAEGAAPRILLARAEAVYRVPKDGATAQGTTEHVRRTPKTIWCKERHRDVLAYETLREAVAARAVVRRVDELMGSTIRRGIGQRGLGDLPLSAD